MGHLVWPMLVLVTGYLISKPPNCGLQPACGKWPVGNLGAASGPARTFLLASFLPHQIAHIIGDLSLTQLKTSHSASQLPSTLGGWLGVCGSKLLFPPHPIIELLLKCFYYLGNLYLHYSLRNLLPENPRMVVCSVSVQCSALSLLKPRRDPGF